jgi:hypothetical protein
MGFDLPLLFGRWRNPPNVVCHLNTADYGARKLFTYLKHRQLVRLIRPTNLRRVIIRLQECTMQGLTPFVRTNNQNKLKLHRAGSITQYFRLCC